MTREQDYHFETLAIHAGVKDNPWSGATLPPLFQTAAHWHEDADNLSRTFSGQTQDHIYMRLTNPTNSFLEKKLALLESAKGATLMASGMAAISNGCMALLRAGDEFAASRSLFMSSYTLFTTIFKKYGIRVRLFDPLDLEDISQNITHDTRFVYIETITNPKMEIPDIRSIADLAHDKGVPLVVDNTLASPWLCRPIELGADIVMHSTTKYLSGHGAALGGVVLDAGRFDWSAEKFEDFTPFVEAKGDLAYSFRLFKEHHVNFGATPAPMHSFLTAIGLDTLGLRMERHMVNAMAVAQFLREHPKVTWVNYPGFDDHPCHHIAKQQFNNKGFGAMMAFGLEDQQACFNLIDHLDMILNLANLGDCKTLIIHPYSSQYATFPQKLKEELADPCLIRFSTGIEHHEDICRDLERALSHV
ncbi:MAG: O-acetylhomoserine aminocarboxypropyltransferase/cysteine synthase [Desulfobacteraceae bacterium]|nr:MAG: O-acetylhomoserine aminocarboxypropyltransferase/cysteine synthase [Desulfobacteraceae bacterium]